VSTLHERLIAATSPLTVAEERTPEELAAALRAVVELHAPVTYWRPWVGEPPSCQECLGPLGDHVAWPCSTIQAIALELGVDGDG